MKIGLAILAFILGLLSIAAGVAKVTLVPAEVEFLAPFGFSERLIIIFGVMQVVAGILLALPATRYVGGVVVSLLFLLSTTLIMANGDLVFGIASLLPVIVTGAVIYQTKLIAARETERDA